MSAETPTWWGSGAVRMPRNVPPKQNSPSGFDAFWTAFPKRVGKLAAEKAYSKALKLATLPELLAGVERYKQSKPAYADWCHPATWLNQGRWMDEGTTPTSGSGRRWQWDDCPHDPHCGNATKCQNLTVIEEARRR